MRLTKLIPGEGSLGALVERLYPQLGESGHKAATTALLKANPHLADSNAFQPDVVVNVPSLPGPRPNRGTAADDPVETKALAANLRERKTTLSAEHQAQAELLARIDKDIASWGVDLR